MLRFPLCVLVAFAIPLGACTLERRADLEPENGAGAAAGSSVAPSTVDSVHAVVSSFHEALAQGDGARIAALTAPGAVLIDQEEGVRWRRAMDSDPALPTPLARTRDGLGWTVLGTEFTLLGDNAGILVTEYRARVQGEDVPWSAVESLVLVRGEAGWRVQYLHQSRGPGGQEQDR